MTVEAIGALNTSQLMESVRAAGQAQPAAALPFEDLLSEAIGAVEETDTTVRADMLSMALGDSEALHNLSINAAKAELAVYTMVAVRNKALDAYNEVMRITL